jgi:cold-inducible RNA-binding protein
MEVLLRCHEAFEESGRLFEDCRCLPQQGVNIVNKKLNVDNLTLGVNDSDLEALFAPYGTVQSAHVVLDSDTGGSKGFGFVEMATCDQAQAAIAALNGKDSNGKTLNVNEASPPDANVVVIVGAATGKPF